MCRATGFLLTIFLFVTAVSTTSAQNLAQFYKPIRPVQPTQVEDGKIEVVEIFWYGCPHCYSFEPYVDNWLKTKADDIEFRRIPGIFSDKWMPHAKAYYTAMKMGVLDKIHQPLFEALHRQKKRIYNDKEIKEFFIQQGIDGNEFSRVYNSNEINIKVRQAFIMGKKYGVTGVPSVVVNGKYLTSGTLARSFDNLLKVIDQLADKEREESRE